METASIFISHASQDRAAAEGLAAALRRRDFHGFFLDLDPERGIPVGANWEKTLYRKLLAASAVLFLGSRASAASKWCFAELAQARALGKQILPLLIEDCALPGILGDTQAVRVDPAAPAGYDSVWPEIARLGVSEDSGFPWDERRPPYPGMPAFDEADAGVFFGRGQEIRELQDLLGRMRLGDARIAAVVGPSGSGKSSVVRAGLLPRLRRNRRDWVVLEPAVAGRGALERLAESLAGRLAEGESGAGGYDAAYGALVEAAAADGALAGGALSSLLRRLRLACGARDGDVVWVFDQAERFLTGGAQAETALRLIASCAGAEGLPLRILLTVRSDHVDALQASGALAAHRFERYNLGPLPPARFGEVIEGPARLAGLELAPGLVAAMVADASRPDGLPLLAFALHELWERSGRERGRLRLEDYTQALGGLEGSVGRRASQVMAGLDLEPDALARLRETLCRMARLGEAGAFVGQPVPWSAVPAAATGAVQALVDARLLVSGREAGQVEVAHEVLFRAWEQLAGWLEAERDLFRFRRRVAGPAQEWEARGRDTEQVHLSGALLTQAAAFLESDAAALGEQERSFIEASVERQRREEARWQRAYQESLARRLAAQAQVTLGYVSAELTARGLLLGIESMRRCAERGIPSLEADQALRHGLARAPPRVTRRAPAVAIDSAAAVDVGPADGAIAFGETDGKTGLWNPFRGTLTPGPSLGSAARVVAYSGDGRRLALGGAEGECLLVEVGENAHRRLEVPGATAPAAAACFSRDSRHLAFALGNRVLVWDLEERGAPPRALVHAGATPVVSLAFSADADVLVTQAVLGDTRVWRWREGTLAGHFGTRGDRVLYSPDGRYLAMASASSFEALLYDIYTGETHNLAENAARLAFSPDGRHLAMASPEHFAQIWQLPERVVVQRLGHNAEVWGVAFSPDGEKLVTAAKNAVAHVWRAGTGEELARLVEGEHLVTARYLPDSRHVLTHSGDGSLSLWDTERRRTLCRLQHKVAVLGVAFSPDGRLLATAARTGRGQTEPVLIEWRSQQPVASVGLPDGERLEGTVYAQRLLDEHRKRSTATVASADGSLTAVADGSTVHIRRAGDDGEPLRSLPHEGSVDVMVFSADGRHLLTTSRKDTARIWEVESGNEVSRLTHARPNVTDADFSPDGRLVATASWDCTARIWLWRPEDLVREASTRVERELTGAEWAAFLPGEPPRATRILPEPSPDGD